MDSLRFYITRTILRERCTLTTEHKSHLYDPGPRAVLPS